MEVVVGTYNNILFGFTFELQEDDNKKAWNFKPLFTDQGHSGCIKTVSTGGRYLASGSTDETIRLFDMKKNIEVGTLVQQDGSITSLVFCGTSHMLSGSDDGTICIWKSKTWELEKILKGHKGAINSISLHPSGRLALSVSKDKSIKTWNLLTGRTAYTTSIKEVGEIVHWSPKGDAYAIVVGCRVTVYKIKGVHDPIVYSCDKYILAITFLNESVMLLAGESDDIILYNFEKKLVLQRIAAHTVRTKDIHVTSYPNEDDKLLLFTVASNGSLKAWSLTKEDLNEEACLLASLDLPGRPTCMTVRVPPEQKNMNIAGGKNKLLEKKGISDSVQESVTVESRESTQIDSMDASEEEETEDVDSTEDEPHNISKETDDITTEDITEETVKGAKKNRKSSSELSSSSAKRTKKKKKKNIHVGE